MVPPMLTLSQVKLHLRLDHDEEDELLDHLVQVARSAVEKELKRTWSEVVEAEGVAGAAPVQHAALLLIGHYYEHREEAAAGAVTTIPRASKSLLFPFRRLV